MEPSRCGGEGWGGSRLIPAQRPRLAKRLRPGRGEGRPGDRGRCATVKCRLLEPRRFWFRGLGSFKLVCQCVPGIVEQARASGRPGSAGRDGGVVEVTVRKPESTSGGSGRVKESVCKQSATLLVMFLCCCVRRWDCTLKEEVFHLGQFLARQSSYNTTAAQH